MKQIYQITFERISYQGHYTPVVRSFRDMIEYSFLFGSVLNDKTQFVIMVGTYKR